MANKTINALTELAEAPADNDEMIIRDTSGPNDRKLLCKYFAKTDGTEITFTGGGVGVTEAGTQTLTNKTLTAPAVNLPTLVLKQSVSPLPTAEGDIQWDTNGDFLVVGNGASQTDIPSAASTHTLSNKTLTTPTIGDFTNATHDHADAAGGGATLASPTLTTPTIADLTNATHDHADAAGGGALGTYATLTGTETLTNKTLTAPSITGDTSISHGTYGGTPHATYGRVFIEDNDNTGLTIGTPSDKYGLIAFADVENNGKGYIKYDHTSDLMTITANSDFIRINGDGVGINLTPNSSSYLTVGGNTIIIDSTRTPASAGATGVKGMIAYDTSYFYVCTATNTWTRVALAW